MAMRDWVIKDLGWKLFSLALAVVIWLVVQTIRSDSPVATAGNPLSAWTTRTFTNLPVLVVSAAADVREFKVNPNTVDVTVSGQPGIIAVLSEKEIHVTVDLTDIEAARNLRKRIDVSTPTGVTFVRVTPADVDVVVPPRRGK